jgi:anti-anti-sigma regulatory factor
METMLNIRRQSSSGRVVLSLSGRIEMEDVAELQRLLSLEPADQKITLDLGDVTLIDRDAVKFLADWESNSIQLENCPAYIREWMGAERGESSQER